MANGIDAAIDSAVRPVSDAIREVVFYSVSVMGTDVEEAAVVVALFGTERSPEILVELGFSGRAAECWDGALSRRSTGLPPPSRSGPPLPGEPSRRPRPIA